MKKHLLFIPAFLFSFLVNAQSNHLEKRQLRGKVKSVTELNFEVVEKFGEPEKGKLLRKDFVEYNSAGYETEYRSEEPAAGSKTTKLYQYENKSRLTEMEEEKAGKKSKTKIEYNALGKITTVDFTDEKGSLNHRQKYRYDANNSLVQIDTYKGDGSLYYKVVYTHDAKQNVVKKERFDAQDKSTWLEIFAYDNKGNLVEETSLEPATGNRFKSTRKYAYNDKKQKIEEQYVQYNADGSLKNELGGESFEYNLQGDEIKRSLVYISHTTEYTYDKHNNWIKAVKTSASELSAIGDMFGKPKIEIVEREIKYY